MANTPLPIRCPEHARTDERVGQLEARQAKVERSLDHVYDLASSLNGRLERMEGKLDGAMGASKITGAVIAALVTTGLAGVGGLILFLLQRRA